MRRLSISSLVLLLAAGLAGCANGVGAVKLDSIPDELASSVDIDEPRPAIVWDDDEDDDAWLVLTFGSSSCPNEPREIIENADGSFDIRLEVSGGPVCTADLGATAYRVPAPVAHGTPVTIDLGPGTRVTL